MVRRRKNGKKKKTFFSRVFKTLGVLLLILIAALILIPYFFKDELKKLALEEANKILVADVAVGDFELTIFSTFPKMNLEFKDVSITGRNQFKDIKLVDLKELDVRLDFWSVINMEDITVRSIRLVQPNINVIVLPDGTANYDIVKSDSTAEGGKEEAASPFEFELSSYEIIDGNITYNDQQSPMFAEIKNLNHKGELDILKSGEEIDLDTKTTIDALSYKMDGVSYANKIKTKLDMALNMIFNENSSKFTLKDNKLTLNALSLSFDGFYQIMKDYSDMDLKLKAGNISFKDLLSLIPAFYRTGYEKMVTKGSLSLGGFVKGKLSDNSYPAWNFNLKVNNASIKYPDMPSTIDHINIVAGSKFVGGGKLDLLTVDIPKFSAVFVGNTIDANFFLKNPMSDPFIETKMNANIDLASIGKVYPLKEEEKYNGKLTSNISFKGRLSTIEKKEYDKIDAKGSLQLKEVHYASAALPAPINISNMLFEFSPRKLKLADLTAQMGQSDFKMSGNVENYMAYLFDKGVLQGNFNYHSNLLNVDEIYPATDDNTTTSTTDETRPSVTDTLNAPGSEEPFLVPKNIDFDLRTTVDKLVYDGMNIEDVKGNVQLKNQVATLTNLSMNTMGGTVAVNGDYNTQNAREPKVNFSYNLKHIRISELAENFLTIEKLAPIAKYVDGYISSDFTMNTSLKPSLEPIYNTLNGEGALFSNQVVIEGFKPLQKLGDALNIESLKRQTINNLRAAFQFTEGKLKLRKPLDVKLGGITTQITGYTSFTQEIEYQLQMNIPKDKLPSKVIDIAEQAVSKIKNIPGFEMAELPNEIPVTAFVTNTIKDPKIKTNLKEKLMELGGDVKGQVKDLIEDKVQEVKDTVKQVIQKTKEDVNKEIEKQKQVILDAAQKQADKLKVEAKKLADKTRNEAEKQAQKLIDNADDNPFKKAGAKVAAKKIREEGEKTAKGIEDKAQQQADAIMQKARQKSDGLSIK